MYEIIMIESLAGSGNLRGSLVVSMSNARTTGSWVWEPGNGITLYGENDAHRPVRFIIDESYLRRIRATPLDGVPVTHVNFAVDGNPDMVGHVVLPHVQYVLQLTG